MADTPRILAFAASTRSASFNRQLARVATECVRQAGGDITLIELKDYPMPLYEGDLEAAEGIPEHGKRLKALLAEHQGLLVVSPEYNGFITPLLKNTLDWLSRPDGDQDGLALFRDRLALVLSASPGALGGLRSLTLARQLLTNLGVMLMPDSLAVGRAHEAFNDNDTLKDDRQQARLQAMTAKFVTTLHRLNKR
ncbi:hypothetical protein A167_02342 [Alcanivorax sp. S71-1-4]|uniref:NADPH-dependent FMN reductase n=1 Tax=Alcanivorax sp. S71-1-4 TaxID=1177159 RepID=UPI0013589CA1|nr:NAD(P)H-dependent oxidoreductase [Alcanivorax sp. S71-1-4]KAF0808875.1 hypothetical protein A167_02342 [Alcanivorax sp. S71-1-4]